MKILIVLSLIAVAFISLVGWYRWDSAQNRGNEFGYYGDFNRVSNPLASISGVVITQAWHHEDITLEEFGFHLTTNGQSVSLHFGETDPVRNFKRAAAVAALQQRIATALAQAQPGE